MSTEAQSRSESYDFQAEVSRVLQLMVRSVYSESEIFLRELISNSADASDRLRYEALTDASLQEADQDFTITITTDREAGTLMGADTGTIIGLGQRATVRLVEAEPVTGGLELELLALENRALPRGGRPSGRRGAQRKPGRSKARRDKGKRKVARRRK